MGRRENTIITKTCTYNVPDDYLHQTNTLGKTGSYEYTGPDKLWIFVDETTGKPAGGTVLTIKDDGDEVPTPPGVVKVFIDATVDTVMASLVWRFGDYSTLPTISETLPDGSVYERNDPQPPDHTFEFMDCVYNISTGQWVQPLPWKQPHVTWDMLRAARTGMLAASDQVLVTKMLTEEQLAAFEVYRQKLRDLPAVMEGVDPWKVKFPEDPLMELGVR